MYVLLIALVLVPQQTPAPATRPDAPALAAAGVDRPATAPASQPGPPAPEEKRCEQLAESDSLFSALCLDTSSVKNPAESSLAHGALDATKAALPIGVPAATALLATWLANGVGLGGGIAGLVGASLLFNSEAAMLVAFLVTPAITFTLASSANALARVIMGGSADVLWKAALVGAVGALAPLVGALAGAAGGAGLVLITRAGQTTDVALGAIVLGGTGGVAGLLVSGPAAAVASVALDHHWPDGADGD